MDIEQIGPEIQAVIFAGLCCVGFWVVLTWFIKVRVGIYIKSLTELIFLEFQISCFQFLFSLTADSDGDVAFYDINGHYMYNAKLENCLND